MVANDVNITIEDGALGVLPTPTDQIHAVIGCTSIGTAQQIFSSATVKALVDNFGYGPAVEAAALSIQQSGAPVLFIKVASSTPGAAGAVTHVGTGTSVVTETGAPFDTYSVKVLVINGGTIGVTGITFQVSMDGGRTYNPVVSLGVAVTYLIPNTNMTLNFAAGTMVAGDTFTFLTTEPIWTIADVQSAIDLLIASVQEFSFVHVVGKVSASDASAIDTKMTAAATQFRYIYAQTDARDHNVAESEATWIASLQTAFAGFSSLRVSVGAGYYLTTSPISGRQYRRPLGWSAASRACDVSVHTDLGRVLDGALQGVSFGAAGDGEFYHDERVTPGLDAARFLTARTLIGKAGVFILNPNIMTPAGSDFTLIQFRRVMDLSCRTTRAVMVNLLSSSVRLNSTTGFILEKDALAIESRLKSGLRDAVLAPGHASNIKATVSRTDNLSSTRTLNVTVRVLPLGYLKTINVDIAFENPALQAA